MKELTLEELKTRVEKTRERARERAKTRYHLARSLGFGAYEAMALQNSGEATIRRLAPKRDTVARRVNSPQPE